MPFDKAFHSLHAKASTLRTIANGGSRHVLESFEYERVEGVVVLERPRPLQVWESKSPRYLLVKERLVRFVDRSGP
jgi:hypothetical protein